MNWSYRKTSTKKFKSQKLTVVAFSHHGFCYIVIGALKNNHAPGARDAYEEICLVGTATSGQHVPDDPTHHTDQEDGRVEQEPSAKTQEPQCDRQQDPESHPDGEEPLSHPSRAGALDGFEEPSIPRERQQC
ncbi:MAG: hypothetical protein AAB898_01160 [Patescibacteria group bacterium]